MERRPRRRGTISLLRAVRLGKGDNGITYPLPRVRGVEFVFPQRAPSKGRVLTAGKKGVKV